jgi:hypothetical protein
MHSVDVDAMSRAYFRANVVRHGLDRRRSCARCGRRLSFGVELVALPAAYRVAALVSTLNKRPEAGRALGRGIRNVRRNELPLASLI